MAFKIGFMAENHGSKPETITNKAQEVQVTPRKSVVRVYFSDREMTLSYYNDQFDLRRGDIVYVDGKLEGLRGRVLEVNYNFKIKVSDYKKVIAVADTDVKGEFFMAGSHFVTFDRETLPGSKVVTWYKAPIKDEGEFVSGSDDTTFCLDNLGDMRMEPVVVDRGYEYYNESRVRYISVDGARGYAIVEGNKAYEVEFEYHNGEISNLVCSCFCSYNCKHEFAVMLQLRETLAIISKRYEDKYNQTDYFAAINKRTLMALAIENKDEGSFTCG